MEVRVKVYDKVKYEADSVKVAQVEYDNVKGVRVVGGLNPMVQEIEECTDMSGIDDYHEYAIVEFCNGETETFRNSYVDIFRI